MHTLVRPALRVLLLTSAWLSTLAAFPANAGQLQWASCTDEAAAECASGVEAAALRYQPATRELLYTGRIGADFHAYLAAALDAHPEAQTLVVSSLGGVLNPALQAARTLNARGITVRAAGRCASACAMLWVASERRQVEDGTVLGLHSSRTAAVSAAVESAIAGHIGRQKTALLGHAGFPPQVIDRALSTPADRMYWLKARDLVRLGVDCTLVRGTATRGAI
ncbi:MAG TPA: hypothetical protein VFF91_07740 [Pseudoxanthomonas sp.]|nr:hypothetical protein [Pseudoxanthomonas sp.]